MNNKVITAVGVAVLVILGYFLYTNYPAYKESKEEAASKQSVQGQMVEYTDGVQGYFVEPSTRGKKPALILIHEWWGLNDDIKEIADRFAEEGYVALAVDLYNGQNTTDPVVARQLATAVRSDVEPAFENLEAALAYLRSQDSVDTDNLASVGWCFGGGWAYQMAKNGLDIDASVMYYGQFSPEDDFAMMRADILGHFGEEDTSIEVDNVREFQAALQTTNGMHEVYIYPNVGHGFANFRGGDNMAYSEEAAEQAWQRTLEFLEQRFE